MALVVPLLVAGLLQVALDQPLWGFVGLLFDIVVLFWCWGPRDLDLDVAAILDAPDATSRRAAAARLYPPGIEPRLDGASLVAIGFSVSTCLPIAAARSVKPRCMALGKAMYTACTAGSSRRRSNWS